MGSVRSGRHADRTTLAADIPPSRGMLSVRRRSARHGFRRAELTSGRQRMHVACTSPSARTNCGFSDSERCAEPRKPRHDQAWPREPETRPIGEVGHRAMHRPRCENSHDGHSPRGGRSDRPSVPSCERPAARDRAAEPFLPRLHPETQGSSSRTVPDPGLGHVGGLIRALSSSFEPLRDASRVRDVRHASPLKMFLKPRLSCRRPSIARLSFAGALASAD